MEKFHGKENIELITSTERFLVCLLKLPPDTDTGHYNKQQQFFVGKASKKVVLFDLIYHYQHYLLFTFLIISRSINSLIGR